MDGRLTDKNGRLTDMNGLKNSCPLGIRLSYPLRCDRGLNDCKIRCSLIAIENTDKTLLNTIAKTIVFTIIEIGKWYPIASAVPFSCYRAWYNTIEIL